MSHEVVFAQRISEISQKIVEKLRYHRILRPDQVGSTCTGDSSLISHFSDFLTKSFTKLDGPPRQPTPKTCFIRRILVYVQRKLPKNVWGWPTKKFSLDEFPKFHKILLKTRDITGSSDRTGSGVPGIRGQFTFFSFFD